MVGLNNDAILTCEENNKCVYQITDLNKIPIVLVKSNGTMAFQFGYYNILSYCLTSILKILRYRLDGATHLIHSCYLLELY